MVPVNGWPFSVSFVTQGSKVSHRIDMGSHHIKQAIMPLFFTQTTNPMNYQESITIKICGEL